ncbi:MAG TPA: hypothetical protein VF883_23020 [Thermoanaerobaculia bacterium]
MKRQREQQRRERAQAKAEKREQRKIDKANGIETPDDDIYEDPVSEEQLTPSV